MNPIPYPMRSTNPSVFMPVTPQPQFLTLPPLPLPSSTFWRTANVQDHLKELQNTIDLAKAMQKELEMLIIMKEGNTSIEGSKNGSSDTSFSQFSKFVEDNKIDVVSLQSISLEAVNDLLLKLRVQLEPFRIVTEETTPWEEKSAAVRLVQRREKYKRNKLWRKRKRRGGAERLAKEIEQFNQADREADEWRAREIAKGIGKRKVEKMKEIAKLKEKEEKKRLQSELDLVLIVEKLQELRSIRIQKFKKQGRFFPEEDDKFLERVQAAVEEEERQAMAAADTDAAKVAIATAEESRTVIQRKGPDLENLRPQAGNLSRDEVGDKKIQEQISESEKERSPRAITSKGSGSSGVYDAMVSLPIEFYHYYHGSNTDMGTLIEVRRTWDAYIRPGGSRIPGHWVQPPAPADEVWASYLVKPK